MGVHNTTGAANTLFIALAAIVGMALYHVYCLAVGNQGRGSGRQGGLIRAGGWYAVDISMVLNAMLRGRGATDLARMQQCAPPMPAKKRSTRTWTCGTKPTISQRAYSCSSLMDIVVLLNFATQQGGTNAKSQSGHGMPQRRTWTSSDT